MILSLGKLDCQERLSNPLAKQMRPSALMTGFHSGQGKKRALLILVQASSSDGFFFALLKKFFLSLDARLNAVATIEKTAYAEPPHPHPIREFIYFFNP